MTLIYSLIAKDNTVLCDYTEYQGNFQQFCPSILKKVQKNTKGAMKYER